MLQAALAIPALALSILFYRNGLQYKNVILTKTIFPASYYPNGTCTTLTAPGLHFCEDATFWDHESDGTLHHRHVIASCDPGRREWNTVMGPLNDPHPHGALWLYSPGSTPHTHPQRIEFENYPQAHDFHPLGIDISPSSNGAPSNLFVVNHARERSVIEQFTISPTAPTRAVWVRTLRSEYLVSPNAIALTSPTSFYVSNDHFMTRRLPSVFGAVLPLAETLLSLPLGWVSHISLEPNTASPSTPPTIKHTFAALGISFPNGVALSPTGDQAAVASSSLGVVYFYSRTPQTNALTHTHTVPLPFSPDNVAFDQDGTLIAAGHPHFPSLTAFGEGKTDAAPSWVASISPRPAGADTKLAQQFDLQAPVSASTKVSAVSSHEVETLYQSNGTGFSTSTTGLRDSVTGVLYVTGLYADGLLICTPQPGV